MKRSDLELLVHASSLETVWAYYSQSGGNLYQTEVRMAAANFANAYARAADADGELESRIRGKLGEHTDVAEIVERVRTWGTGEAERPYGSDSQTRFMLFALITSLKAALLQPEALEQWPSMLYTSEEANHSARAVRWRAHLPQRVFHREPDELVRAASEAPSIAVMGDIRRSQDLMTYASSAGDFSQRMVRFITETRRLAEKHGGFFDKFTGDGFLVYFSKAVCEVMKRDYLECFVEFVQEEMAFANVAFREWTTSIRKLPAKEVGLTIGADLGVVAFNDINNQLVAVGDSIVWAARMSSAGNANQVIVNNLLYAALRDRSQFAFEPLSSETKAGESFRAHRMSWGVQPSPDDGSQASQQ